MIKKVMKSFSIICLLMAAYGAMAKENATTTNTNESYDVKKGIEKVQYEWTRLNEKDKELLKESSEHEKEADLQVKKELEAYREKTDELYNALSPQSKKFISDKSKLYKKMSNKAKKFLDELYFLVKKGVRTFQIPGIDDLMPLSGVKSDNTPPTKPVVNGKPVGTKE